MATDPALREKLLEKLGVTPQALSLRVQKRKKELPMSTPHAVYTIAHDEGMDVAKYLSADETKEVRGLISALQRNGQPAPAKAPRAARKTRSGPAEVKIVIAGVEIGKIPGLSRAHANDAKVMSESVYPLLYIFENSVRDFIEHILKAKYGADWWSKAVPPKIQANATSLREQEEKEPWHSARGRREIDYSMLSDLWSIIKDKWSDFKLFLPSQAWVESLITGDMNVSRRVLAHMNPLAPDDIKNIEAAFRKWTKQLQGIEKKLP
jgi:hypothetical protein